MVPRRISVKGFLCYRDRQEVHFDGAPLWMLSGPNGSGKSTLFDAVTFALFGRHRAGQRNAKELVNKACDGLEVEFDFLLDGELFQARRTLRRQTNRSTRQVRRCPASPEAGGAWEEVPATDTEEGFADWVRDHLGVTHETFTSSALLLQGRAEQLLDADAAERRRVLANLVGLDRFERLFARVDGRRKDLQAEARVLQNQLAALPAVPDTGLRAAEERVREGQADWGRADAELEQLHSVSLALPLLSRLQRERQNLRHGRRRLAGARKRQQAAQARLGRVLPRHGRLLDQARQARAARQQADQRVTRAATLLEEACRRAAAFQEMAGGPACRSCGQPLTPGHVAAETARLHGEERAARAEHLRAVAALEKRVAAEERLAALRDKADRALTGARALADDAERRAQDAEREILRSGAECRDAFRQLPQPFRSHVAASEPDDWAATEYPSEDDLRQLRTGKPDLDPNEIASRIEAARRALAVCAEKLREAEQERDRLVECRARREAVHGRLLAVQRELNLHQTLAELLGPRRLQLELVRRAERGIVAYANAVLDRLSGGQLYLRLRAEDEAADVSRALDLEAFDRAAAGSAPLDVRLLSGSQRFRVAVSLALGLGQYASRQHRPVEAVIIDEGFGCLDREGRQGMIQELQNLRGQLRCVILVSHQEEFADAFRDGYRFELHHGSARVTPHRR